MGVYAQTTLNSYIPLGVSVFEATLIAIQGSTVRKAGRALAGISLLGIVASTAVTAANPVLKLHPPDRQQLNFAALSAIVEEEAGVRLIADPSDEAGDDPLASLRDGSADLAILENTRPFREGVRTIIPLYNGVVHIAARSGISKEVFLNRERPPVVHIVGNSHTGALVADMLFDRAVSIPGVYRRWTSADVDEPDFIFYVGPIDPQNTSWFRPGFELISLARIDSAGAEFYTQGISYLVPQLEPSRIPARTYSLPGNEEGIDTLAVKMLLTARRDLDAETVYRLVATLVEQKARFAAVEPALFRWMRADNLTADFSFPLHRGARQYLERDEPGFLERYAELLNFFVYVIVLIVTGVLGLGRWRARRRKDRIDTFYVRVFELRRTVGLEDSDLVLQRLEEIEAEAFAGLIDERLAADDSFRIFTELADGLRRELKGY